MIRSSPVQFLAQAAFAVGAAVRAAGAAFALGKNGMNWDRLQDVTARAAENRGWPDLSRYKDQAALFERAMWFYIGTDLVANAGGLTNLNVKRYVNEKKIGIVNHPLEQLLRCPNEDQSQLEFMYETIGFLWVNGNSYWYCAGSPGGVPQQLMNMRPDRIRIVPGLGNGRRVKGYVYIVDGVEVPLDAEEVVHLKLWSARDDYYGLSRVQAGRMGLLTDLGMEEWNRNNFQDEHAVPAGLVNIEDFVNDNDFDRIKREWKESYGGTKNATAFVRGNRVTWQSMGLNQREMEFIKGRQFNKESILQLTGVWPGLLDPNATEANARAHFEFFTSYTIWPLMNRIAQKIQVELAPFYGSDLIVEPDDIRVKDKQAELEEIKAASSFLVINEIRQKYYDLPARPDGDIYAAGAGAAAIGGPAVGNAGFDRVPMQVEQPKADKQTAQQEAAGQASTGKAEPLTIEPVPPALITGKVLEVDPVIVTSPIRQERQQFHRYASKGKSVDSFVFQQCPEPLAIAFKALADVHQLDLLTEKAIMPASQRVSISGAVDPNAKEKERSATALTKAFASALADLQSSIVDGVKHVASNDPQPYLDYFDNRWWKAALSAFVARLYAPYYDVLESAAQDSADISSVQSGVGFDDASLAPMVKDAVDSWASNWLPGIMQTTRAAFEAMLSRWAYAVRAKIADLVSAVQESPIFGEDRATTLGETENTRAWGTAVVIGALVVAAAGGQKVDNNLLDKVDDLCPAHPNCVCFVDGDMVWHALRDGHVVCQVCDARDGKTIAEIVSQGL